MSPCAPDPTLHAPAGGAGLHRRGASAALAPGPGRSADGFTALRAWPGLHGIETSGRRGRANAPMSGQANPAGALSGDGGDSQGGAAPLPGGLPETAPAAQGGGEAVQGSADGGSGITPAADRLREVPGGAGPVGGGLEAVA